MTYKEEKAKLEAEIVEHAKAGRVEAAVAAGRRLKELEADNVAREQKDREDREARIRKEREEADRTERRALERKVYPEKWMRNIPLGRRFVLAIPEKAFSEGYTPRDEIAPIDLATGYMEPYFGYYGRGAIEMSLGDHAMLERLDELRDSTDAIAYVKNPFGFSIFNFFHVNEHYRDLKFGIAPFSVDQAIIAKAREQNARKYPGSDAMSFYYGDAYGALEVGKRGPCKTWGEHLADLKREFGGGE